MGFGFGFDEILDDVTPYSGWSESSSTGTDSSSVETSDSTQSASTDNQNGLSDEQVAQLIRQQSGEADNYYGDSVASLAAQPTTQKQATQPATSSGGNDQGLLATATKFIKDNPILASSLANGAFGALKGYGQAALSEKMLQEKERQQIAAENRDWERKRKTAMAGTVPVENWKGNGLLSSAKVA